MDIKSCQSAQHAKRPADLLQVKKEVIFEREFVHFCVHGNGYVLFNACFDGLVLYLLQRG